MSASPCVYLRTKSSKNISLNFLPDVRSAEELLHEHKVETTTSFVKYYNYGVGKGKSKVRGAPQMNSAYGRKCQVEGCRGLEVMGRSRGGAKRGSKNLPIKALHKNLKSIVPFETGA